MMQERIDLSQATEFISTGSAGVAAIQDSRLNPTVGALLAKRGLPRLGSFRARMLTESLLDQADLILTGARSHRLYIGERWPESYTRTFTLRECAVMINEIPSHTRAQLPPELPYRALSLLACLQERRTIAPVPAAEIDIADPLGRRKKVFKEMIHAVSESIGVLSESLFHKPAP
jgi:protein-tyrosine-phosphatase